MTLFGLRGRRSLNSPSVPLTASSLAEWLSGGQKHAGVLVSEQSVWGLSAYYRAIALVSGTVAQLPLHVYRSGTRTKALAVGVPGNRRQTDFELWQTVLAHALGWGTAYARKVRDDAGLVRELWPVHPSRVRVEEVDPTDDNPEGLLLYVTTRSGRVDALTCVDVARFPFLSPDGVVGLSPLRALAETLGVGLAAQQSAGGFYANGSMLSGILTTKDALTQEQAEAIKARWRDKVGVGAATAGDVAVLDNGATFQPLAIPPGDAQLLESRRFTVQEVARMFGIPPHMLGDVAGSTSWGTGIEQQVLGWVKFSLGHWLALMEQRVTRELLPGGWDQQQWYARYKLDALLRGDSTARTRAYATAIHRGWLSRNEVRAYEELDPVDGLDEYLVPVNLTTADLAEQDQELATDGGDADVDAAA